MPIDIVSSVYFAECQIGKVKFKLNVFMQYVQHVVPDS